MIEVRSYRRVFDLERRIYSVDRLRLNPGGVPVRGIVYFLGLLLAALLFAGVPLLGASIRGAPWYLRDLLAPVAAATLLSLVRVDGRTFHLAAQALVRFCLQPRRLCGFRGTSPVGERWAPGEMVILPDGSDSRLRRLRYAGPGAALIMVEHRITGAHKRFHLRTAREVVSVSSRGDGKPLPSGKVISLQAEACLLVLHQDDGAQEH